MRIPGKYGIIFIVAVSLLTWRNPLISQDKAILPSFITTGTYLGETPPLRDLPAVSADDWQRMEENARQKMLNPKLRHRSYPYAQTALPKGPDPVWQRSAPPALSSGTRDLNINFQGQTSPYYPPDANGAAGPNHYMQTINATYAIYDKTGSQVVAPTAMNTLFSGVTGSNCNDGDPIVLYDEQADRWFIAEFSICGNNDYMLMAVSTTSDPTGTWYKYSFDVDDMPDYEKFGIWRDGYYMATNNSTGNDIYVFERSVMIAGGASPSGVGFNNPWRPTTIDGFMCVPPLDNDWAFAPEGAPGLFITINDDAIAGGSDQLWIYELDVDWTTLANSTFIRVQQLNVAPFDSNFGSNWDNIAQSGTTQELDAIPQVIMNPPQYRNFGTYETIVCCHTVDVDNTDHAGIRWYELRRTGGSWSVRQQGTYAPDGHSRWMGSIMLNGDNEIALGYSISSSSMYPGIRYCGQSAFEYAQGSGVMDIPEESIQEGLGYQSSYNRWGDYAGMCVDPANDSVFWFTSQYPSASGSRLTRIASFNIPVSPGKWTGAASTAWNSPANWLDGNVPDGTVDVTILPDASAWPVFTGNFTVGTHCRNLTLRGAGELNLSGSLTINAGASLIVTDTGTVRIGGDWTRHGKFFPGSGTIEFTGSTPATINGKTLSGILISDYAHDTFAVGMSALSGANSGPSGDDASSDVPIGFNFYFAGTAYTTAHITTNGWISLNGSGAAGYLNGALFSTTAPNTTLAPWFDDLYDDNTSAVIYKTEGSAPNRVFTVEWHRLRSYAANNNYSRLSFQVKLYETTGIIEFHYGSMEENGHNAGESASIGIEDATGGPGHFIDATTGSMTTGVTNLKSQIQWPAVNYRFTPYFDEDFYNLIINKPGTAVGTGANIKVAGTLILSTGSGLDVPDTKTVNVQGNPQ